MGAAERLRAHAAAKRRQFLVGFARNGASRRFVEQQARFAEQLCVEGTETVEQRLSRLAAKPPRASARASSSAAARSISASNASPSEPFARGPVSRITTRSRCAGKDWRPATRGSSLAPAASRHRLRQPVARRHSSNASSTSASQKSILTGRRRGPLR